jgi:hypothetical protein
VIDRYDQVVESELGGDWFGWKLSFVA